jgi:DNA-binding Lrp family transcriptional regulator
MLIASVFHQSPGKIHQMPGKLTTPCGKTTRGGENSPPPTIEPKKALVDQWYSGKSRLFFLTTTKQSLISFNERIVYSLLVAKLRFGQGMTMSSVAKAVNIERATVRKVVDRLVSITLALKTDGSVFAVEPTGDQADWFALRNSDADDWWDRLAYYPVYLPHSRQPLSPRYNVLLFLLLSLGRGKPYAKDQTYRGLAKLLGIDPKTVKNGITKLVKLGFIEVFRATPESDWFGVGFHKPSAEHLKRFRDVEGGKPDEYVGLDDFIRSSEEEIEPENQTATEAEPDRPQSKQAPPSSARSDRFSHHVDAMKSHGLPQRAIEDVLKLLGGPLIELQFNVFLGYLTDAARDHRKNQRDGKHKNLNHCGNLLIHNLKKKSERDGVPFQAEFAELERAAAERKRQEERERERQAELERESTADYGDAIHAPFNHRLFAERIWGGGYLIPWQQTYGEEICRKGLDLVPHLPKDLQQRIGPPKFEAILKRLAAGEEVEKIELPMHPVVSEVNADKQTLAKENAASQAECPQKDKTSPEVEIDEEQWYRTLRERAQARAAIKKPERRIRPAWMEADAAGVLDYVE